MSQTFLIKATEVEPKRYQDMLEVLPPARWQRGAFLVGEAMSHNDHGEALFSLYFISPSNRRYYEAAECITAQEFDRRLAVYGMVADVDGPATGCPVCGDRFCHGATGGECVSELPDAPFILGRYTADTAGMAAFIADSAAIWSSNRARLVFSLCSSLGAPPRWLASDLDYSFLASMSDDAAAQTLLWGVITSDPANYGRPCQ